MSEPSERGNVEQPMNKIYIDGKEHDLEPRTRADEQLAEASVAAIRGHIEACCPHASSDLMAKFRALVDQHEANVRKRLERP